MKAIIEKYLADLGYTNIEWDIDEEGYYVLARMRYGAIVYINIGEFVNELIREER